MDTPSEPATHANHGIDWDCVEAHHHPVTLVRRPVYEGWVLSLFGAILVGLMGPAGLDWVRACPPSRPSSGRCKRTAVSCKRPLRRGKPGAPAARPSPRRRRSGSTRWTSACTRWRAGRGTRRLGSPRWSSVPGNTWPSPRRRRRLLALPPATPTAPQCHQCAANHAGSAGRPRHAAKRPRRRGAWAAPVPESFGTVAGVASGVGGSAGELSGQRPAVRRVPVPHHL